MTWFGIASYGAAGLLYVVATAVLLGSNLGRLRKAWLAAALAASALWACAILLLLGAGLVMLLLTRSDVDATLLRAPGALFQQTPEGKISNLYLLKLTNKTWCPTGWWPPPTRTCRWGSGASR